MGRSYRRRGLCDLLPPIATGGWPATPSKRHRKPRLPVSMWCAPGRPSSTSPLPSLTARCPLPRPATHAQVADNDDDGESGAGAKLAALLELMGVQNVFVVVTRWYGGVHLGPDRCAALGLPTVAASAPLQKPLLGTSPVLLLFPDHVCLVLTCSVAVSTLGQTGAQLNAYRLLLQAPHCKASPRHFPPSFAFPQL